MASFTERYHELSKYHPYSVDRPVQLKWESHIPPFKAIENLPRIPLEPKVGPRTEMPVLTDFGTLKLLTYLLHFTSGVTEEVASENGPIHFRTNFSGGAIYPIEVFFLVRRFDIPDGLYYYDPTKSCILRMAGVEAWTQLVGVVADTATVEKSELVFLYTGILDRCIWRYKENAYRRVLLDAGATLGNTVMHAHAIGLGMVPLSGFVDSKIESLLQLRSGEIPLAALAVDPSIQNSKERFVTPSLEPAVAAKSLAVEDLQTHLQAQLLCQNQAERIPEPIFRAPVPYTFEGVAGKRQKLFESYLTSEDIRCALPIYSWHRWVCRKFLKEKLSFDSLSVTLNLAYNSIASIPESAGFLKHWLLVFSVDSVEEGLYRYLPSEHALVYVNQGTTRDIFAAAHVSAVALKGCSAVLLQTANLDETTAIMGDRGYRYLHLDAGIACEAINIWGCFTHVSCSSDSFYYEDEYKKALDFSSRESIISETVLGIGRL